MNSKLEPYLSQSGMASVSAEDDTARKLRPLQDFTNSHSDKSQQQPQQQSPTQHLPQIQRTHAGFQHTLGPAGDSHGHHAASHHASVHVPPPHHHNQLPPMVDPQLSGGQHLTLIQSPPGQGASISSMLQSPDDPMDHGDSERKGRQLSTTKRAAQNRAAQRAFRQRKEVHIKQLEAKVQEIEPLKGQVVELQRDNYTLRGYLITMLEMIAKKGLEPPPGVPKMQHMDPNAYDPSSMPVDQQNEEPPSAGGSGASRDNASRSPDYSSSQHGVAGAPTAPMQDIAQQASQAVDGSGAPQTSSS